ncbi:MAG: hypothetical protein ACPH56_09370, partial [Spongiibacter marinus]|uniref:hypothetical protein n=1 Tax=Spongiibacter marinus TaxID=354246 RepID=UPI003C62D7A1
MSIQRIARRTSSVERPACTNPPRARTRRAQFSSFSHAINFPHIALSAGAMLITGNFEAHALKL